jgi:TRAP-type transport system periplasmic protein
VLRKLLCCGVLALSGPAGSIAGAPAPAHTALVVGVPAGAGANVEHALGAWCERLAAQSRGELACRPGFVRIASGSGLSELRSGKVDLAVIEHSREPERFAASSIGDLPFLGRFAETTSVAYQQLYARSPAMANEHRGTKVLAMFVDPPGLLVTSAARVRHLHELAPAGAASNDPVAARASAEVQAAIQASRRVKGDGRSPWALARLSDPVQPVEQRSVVMVPGGVFNTSHALAVNPARWASLGTSQQAVLTSLSGVEGAAALGRDLDAVEWKASGKARIAGILFFAPEPELQAEFGQALHAREARWGREAARAGLRQPAATLARFRADIQNQEAKE